MQYAVQRVGPKGLVVGVDRTDIRASLPPNVHFLQGDIFEIDPAKLLEIGGGPFDLLISDAAPQTTGVVFADHARSIDLSRRTLEIARAVVREGGAWLCKIFQGEDLPAFRAEARRSFRKLIEEKPKSSRDRSVEIFLVGLGHITGS